MFPAFPPSNSYGVRVQCPATMNWSLRHTRPAADAATRHASSRQRASASEPAGTPDFPMPGEVLGEIGLILAVHLSVALAVTLVLQAFGIA